MSRIVLTAASRVGCVRSNNEDMVLAYDRLIRGNAYRTEFRTDDISRFVIALADGMGGHKAGEVASEETLSNLKFFVCDIPDGLSSGQFHETMMTWLTSINHVINSRGYADMRMREMGTTLVGMLYYAGRYYWMNCGDSRLYRLRDGVLLQLTTDHSLNVLQGQSKHSNVITNCIGAGSSNSYLDMVDITDDVKAGDTYMLCSDGLSDMVPDAAIQDLMNDGATANRLCQAAIDAGGYDNVSVCVFTVS
ncbi:MAG: serine/threonine-protein phosphatase [Prevotella sp.]|nr:serine/threonine-protein phosphatase [Prevotella sp.]